MCMLYVSCGSKIRPRTFGYVSMGNAVLFILRSRLLLYSSGYVVNGVQVLLLLFAFQSGPSQSSIPASR